MINSAFFRRVVPLAVLKKARENYVMNDASLLPKRIRRCEVSDMVFAEELTDLRAAVRALYESLLLVCRRLPESALGSAPADMLMMPPWYESPCTGDVLPPPLGLVLDQSGLGAFRFKLSLLSPEQLAELQSRQTRLPEQLEKLRKREADREKQLKQGGPRL